MTEEDIIMITQRAIQTILLASSPVLAAALGVGLFIAFFQALTQIQEMTLTFVPKIVIILLVLMVSLPFILGQITTLTDSIFEAIRVGSF